MAGRISRGWALLRDSWSVVRVDKNLLIFPVLSAVACLLVVASFALPMVLNPHLAEMLLGDGTEPGSGGIVYTIASYALLFLFYFANYFVVVFFNTALISCAITRFRGGEPTVGGGLRAAAARMPQIIGWALLAATVGMILRAIEDRSKLLGKIVVNLIGLAWAVVTYLVLPVLVVEGLGPFAAVRRSAAVLKETWGESLTGQVSLGVLNFLFALPGLGLIIAGATLGATSYPLWAAILCGGLGLLYLIGLAIVLSTLQQVFLAAVYLHASERLVPMGFSEDSLRSAFRRKS